MQISVNVFLYTNSYSFFMVSQLSLRSCSFTFEYKAQV